MRALVLILLSLPAHAEWRALAPGFELGTFAVAPPEGDPDPVIHVVRVDARRFALQLLTASARDEAPETARGWALRAGAWAVINASMYQQDHRSSVGLMVGPGFVNNPRLSKDQTVLAFGPRGAGLPAWRIIDRSCEPFEALRTRYRALVQGIRMLDCAGAGTWSQRARRHSHAVFGVDRFGRFLMIHAAAAWTTHDFIDALRRLPLDLRRLQYADGSYPAQLYVGVGDFELFRLGRRGVARLPMAIPNVLGVVPRAEAGIVPR